MRAWQNEAVKVTVLERLAPGPDFRYVGFEPAPRGEVRVLGSLLTGGATAAVALLGHASALSAVFVGVMATAVTAIGMRAKSGPIRRWGARGVRLGFTPWGVVVEAEDADDQRRHVRGSPAVWSTPERVLRWAGIERIHLEMVYGRDQHTPSTLFSNVTVDTPRERFAARAHGAVPLESVLVHMEAYAREQAHVVALDLDGTREGDGPLEPDFEPLLSSALESIESAPSSQRLGLPAAGYRKISARVASNATIALLRSVLRDRSANRVDPRPLAAVIAGELGATELSDDLLALTSSPHPLLAAVARSAALRLGAHVTKAGAIDEVAPFLHPADVETITRWAGSLALSSFAADESVRITGT